MLDYISGGRTAPLGYLIIFQEVEQHLEIFDHISGGRTAP